MSYLILIYKSQNLKLLSGSKTDALLRSQLGCRVTNSWFRVAFACVCQEQTFLRFSSQCDTGIQLARLTPETVISQLFNMKYPKAKTHTKRDTISIPCTLGVQIFSVDAMKSNAIIRVIYIIRIYFLFVDVLL